MMIMKKNDEMKPIWQEVIVVTSQVAADLVSDKLIELGSQGTVFDEDTRSADLCKITAYYPMSMDIKVIIQEVIRYLEVLKAHDIPIGNPEVLSKILEDTDWAGQWKRFFKPIRIGKHLVIKPSWEKFEARPEDLIIEIDPGMAFGTGLHASTRLMLTLMEQYLRPGNMVLDVGIGSGILTIAAARLGANHVLGVDVDAEAIEVACENVVKNSRIASQVSRLEDRIELEVGSLDTLTTSERFDCILMNIRPNIILPLMPYAETYLQTGGAVIISGILEEEGPDLVAQLHERNFLVQDHRTEEGWIAYVLSYLN
ncbi:ribosomal protein L11 methyltransferase [Candidatus Vecturithrix granuli]|uniref:Ribosomal protein L11 methyltransferase n=1 Tax=Vecturithrix granuli TaxID=1499967 RepID=A0A081C526_VECG1|nr:ribosomal protein L11 methyltransferase [Candidatus Vecturithrix granuli]